MIRCIVELKVGQSQVLLAAVVHLNKYASSSRERNGGRDGTCRAIGPMLFIAVLKLNYDVT